MQDRTIRDQWRSRYNPQDEHLGRNGHGFDVLTETTLMCSLATGSVQWIKIAPSVWRLNEFVVVKEVQSGP